MKWASRLGKELPKIYHVLDAFGASQKVCNVWQAQGLAGIAYDIKLAAGHDMTAEVGVKEFLRMGLQLHDGGLIAAAPPCSLFVPACASVHRRSLARPQGNQRNFKVRLANRIWSNFATCVHILLSLRPSLYLVIEQPTGSWAFKQPEMQRLTDVLGLPPGQS
ncbi:unnamed protein product [Durusdinium trenchii]|uniref:Uncharacterized protein n=1 Tax=Durusdinium trenchii TaxID=1381693 RepID=A0ABP0S0Y0_9DINO